MTNLTTESSSSCRIYLWQVSCILRSRIFHPVIWYMGTYLALGCIFSICYCRGGQPVDRDLPVDREVTPGRSRGLGVWRFLLKTLLIMCACVCVCVCVSVYENPPFLYHFFSSLATLARKCITNNVNVALNRDF